MDPYGLVTLLLVACISSLLIISLCSKLYRRSPLPPGPMPLPIVGNLLQLKTDKLFQSIMELNKIYGPVFTIYLGTLRVVVLCSYHVIKEALIDQAEDFNGRGKFAGLNAVLGNTGVVLSNGERWKQLRRFSLMTLRNFGMGKRSIEERIQEESQCLVEELRKTKGRLLEPTLTLSGALSNVICSVVFSERFDYEDPTFLALLKLVNEINTHMSSFWGQMYDMFPFVVQYLPGGHNRMANQIKELLDFVSKRVELNQNTLDPNNPRDFIDCFLIKMEKEKSNPGTEYTLRNLISTVLSLFFAGTDTVSTTLRYGFLILLKHPEIEEKIHEEIDHVIGRECIPSTEHRIKMPYTDAVIHEIQRFINLAPTGAPHCTTRDTQFRGYIIPKDTQVFPMLGSVLWDPAYFPNPEKFNPGNFLDADGGFQKSDTFIAFSTGKRVCLGEGLARMELFLFLTSVLQNFKLKPPANLEKLDLEPHVTGIGNLPQIYQLGFVAK